MNYIFKSSGVAESRVSLAIVFSLVTLFSTIPDELSAGSRMNSSWIRQSELGLNFDVDQDISPIGNVPLLHKETLAATRNAIQVYTDIVKAGGWPHIPMGKIILRLGSRHPTVKAIRERLTISGDLTVNGGDPEVFDAFVEEAVRRFQNRHGLIADGLISSVTLKQINVPAKHRLKQLKINLSRIKSFYNQSRKNRRYVLVNIPAAKVEAVESNRVRLHHTAVVGRSDRQSPEVSVKISQVNFNPTWTVPKSIIQKDLIPEVQKNPKYLAENRIHIFDGYDREVQPEDIDWTNSDKVVQYRFRQDPFEGNSMGTMKITMWNKHSVYMHDTPSKTLFGSDYRFHSSGCVRILNIHDLASWLLKGNKNWSRDRIRKVVLSGEKKDILLRRQVPVHWVYITGWSASGTIHFRPDIYSRDGIDIVAGR